MEMTLHGVDGAALRPVVKVELMIGPGTAGNQVILHEDKKYYATAEETYGGGCGSHGARGGSAGP